MGLFDKVTATATSIGKSAMNSAAKVGSSATVTAQEQKEVHSQNNAAHVMVLATCSEHSSLYLE